MSGVFSTSSLTAENLALSRGGRQLFAGVGFALKPGVPFALRGPNGVGKTSLLRALAGLAPFDEGAVRLGDEDWAGVERAPLIHFLAHQDGLKAALTARENLQFWKDFLTSNKDDGGDVEGALDRVGLTRRADLAAGVLSAGQRRRLALARLLIADRPIWLLDEPTHSLDDQGAGLVADLIRDHAAKGGLVMAATHLDLGIDGETLMLERPMTAHKA